jgi:HD-GYP domain-containing protein (c-di-GMP phosphodiesterase class II)
MASSVAFYSGHSGIDASRSAGRPALTTELDPPMTLRMRRYLPLAVLATGFVIVAPVALVTAILPRGGPLLMAASAATTVALSLAIASAGAAVWKRQQQSRDLVFADLMLWGWLRRCWTERRLSQARDLFDTAGKAGPSVNIALLTGLSRLLEARDAYTHGHGQRVALHSRRIARAMNLPPVEVAKIAAAATVHDVGKVFTPREILNNPGALTDEEFTVVKRHATEGAELLEHVGDPEITAMVRHHHERMDGRGYPAGLAGTYIPLGARIIAVADTFDAITSRRPYRPARTQKTALKILSKEAGSQLDSAAVAAFQHHYSARRSVGWLAIAAAVPQQILAGLRTTSLSIGTGTGAGTSLLPALATAGVLSVSPGLHHKTDPHATRPTAPTRSHGATILAAPSGSRHDIEHPVRTQPGSRWNHPGHRTLRTSPVSRNSPASSPNPRPTGTSPSLREPAKSVPTPPTASSPTPKSPAPVNEAPTPPAIAIPLPVTPPGVPSVPLPAGAVPSAPVP